MQVEKISHQVNLAHLAPIVTQIKISRSEEVHWSIATYHALYGSRR
jgi:hypothetical protein